MFTSQIQKYLESVQTFQILLKTFDTEINLKKNSVWLASLALSQLPALVPDLRGGREGGARLIRPQNEAVHKNVDLSQIQDSITLQSYNTENLHF